MSEAEDSFDIRESLLQEAIERVRSRGDSTRRFAVMELPPPLFNDLCQHLLSQNTVRGSADWLAGECAARGIDAPAKSSVERFSDVLLEEYRIAVQRRRRSTNAEFRKVAAEGAKDAGLTATVLLAEKLDDWMGRIDEIEDLDVKELVALSLALRQVNQTLNDKRNSDARIAALEKLNQERDATIKIKDQRLVEMKQKFEGVLNALQSKAQKKDGKITREDIDQARKMVFGS